LVKNRLLKVDKFRTRFSSNLGFVRRRYTMCENREESFMMGVYVDLCRMIFMAWCVLLMIML